MFIFSSFNCILLATYLLLSIGKLVNNFIFMIKLFYEVWRLEINVDLNIIIRFAGKTTFAATDTSSLKHFGIEIRTALNYQTECIRRELSNLTSVSIQIFIYSFIVPPSNYKKDFLNT